MRVLLFLLILASGAVAGPPNIVVFLADDHGRAESSVYGTEEVRTPIMAALAREGMVFDNAFIASPSCGPSRSALLTGLMPARNGAEPNHTMPHDGTMKMVPMLKELGYEVVAFGKVAHGTKQAKDAGFDQAENGRKEELAELVSEFFRKRKDTNKPLCLLVGDHRPHVAWSEESTYDPEQITLPDYLIDTPETRDHWARYLTDITGMDELMGKIDKMARDYFESDDFLFIYTADHGGQWPFGKWNLYDKGVRVAFQARWPGRIEAGIRTDAMVSWIDLFPTLIELGGGSVPDDIDGKSFAEVLLGNKKKHRNRVYVTHSGASKNVYPIRAVRTERFKYIRNLLPDSYHSNQSDVSRKDGAAAYWYSWDEAAKTDPHAAAIVKKYYHRPAIEFYDLENDPDEQINLAQNPEYGDQVEEMSAMLDHWMKEQGDQQRVYGEPYPISGPPPFLVEQEKAAKKSDGEKKRSPKEE